MILTIIGFLGDDYEISYGYVLNNKILGFSTNFLGNGIQTMSF
jgi:hypothetical protein